MTIFHYSLINYILSSLKTNRVQAASSGDRSLQGSARYPEDFRQEETGASSAESISFAALGFPLQNSQIKKPNKPLPLISLTQKDKKSFNYKLRSKSVPTQFFSDVPKLSDEILADSRMASPPNLLLSKSSRNSIETLPSKFKDTSDWVCYSGHEGNFISENTPSKEASQSTKLNKVHLSAREFERQNILECYKKKNLLGLFFAFFDYGIKELDERRAREMKLSVQEASEGNLGKVGESRLGLSRRLSSVSFFKEIKSVHFSTAS
jgi:hypothetical protein